MAKLTRAAQLFQARVVSEIEALTSDAEDLRARAAVTAQTSAIDLIRAIAAERRSDALDQIASILEVAFAQPSTRTLLCPALQRASDNPLDIAKRMTPTLLAQVIAGGIIALPPEPLLFAAFALAVSHLGVSRFCAADEPLATPANSAEDHQQTLRALLETPPAPHPQPERRLRLTAPWVAGILIVLLAAAAAGIMLFPDTWRTLAARSNQITAVATQATGTLSRVGAPAPTAPPVQPTPARTAQSATLRPAPLVAAARPASPTQISPSPAPPSPAPATPAATCSPGIVAGTGDLGLNMREAPTSSAAVRAVLPEGSAVMRCEPSADAEWIRVEAVVEGQPVQGWANAAFVQSLASAGP